MPAGASQHSSEITRLQVLPIFECVVARVHLKAGENSRDGVKEPKEAQIAIIWRRRLWEAGLYNLGFRDFCVGSFVCRRFKARCFACLCIRNPFTLTSSPPANGDTLSV